MLASPCAAKNLIVPETEAQLDQRIAMFEQEARLAACDVHDRLCAMGRYKFALAALELAQVNPECRERSCAERKSARHRAASAWWDEVRRQTGPARGDDLYDDFLMRHANPNPAAVEAYSAQVEHDLTASRCPETEKACAAGRLVYVEEIDQLVRFQSFPCEAKPAGEREACMVPVGERMQAIDALSRSTLDRIVDRFGWPDEVHWGRELQNTAWLLAQHADEDQKLQTKFYKLIEASFEQGYTPAVSYAYIADRQAMHQNKPQLYGTQGRCVGESDTRHWEPNPIADETHLDARRAAAGMEPYAQYRKITNEMCKGKP